MRRRYWGLLVLAVFTSVFLAGCNDPDKNFQKGKYKEAYPEFIKRAGTNEATLRNEAPNGTFEPRQKAGNQALHDLYYAAECQKRLGNTKEAEALFRRVVALSQYQIRIPHDQSALLKDSMSSLLSAAREVRTQELSYGRALRDWRNQPPPSDTDPYDNNPGGGNTDPYGGGSGGSTDPYGGGSGSNTDPYAKPKTGSNTDPYAKPKTGSNTDPYAKPKTGGSTDPYAGKVQYATTSEPPSRFWLDNAVSTLRTRQRDFERLLFSTTPQQVPDIAKVKSEYDRFTRLLDNYLGYGAPGGIFFSPDSMLSQIAWNSLENGSESLRRVTYGAAGNVTYQTQPLQVKEPNLVAQAKAALDGMGVSYMMDRASGGGQDTTGTNNVTIDSTSSSPFGE